MELTVDLRPQHTRRGRAVQQADCDRIAGVLHYASAIRGRHGAARHIEAAHRRLMEAAKGYQQGGIGLAWWCVARWAHEVEQTQTTFAAGAFPAAWAVDSTSEVF